MTHYDEQTEISMYTKRDMADGYDLYLSVHSNAGGSDGAIMFCDVNPDYNDKPLAEAILRAHCKANGVRYVGLWYIEDSGVGNGWNNLGRPVAGRTNYYAELNGNSAKVPLLFERFFHDNRNDVAKSTTEEAIEKSTRAVADVIISMKGNGKVETAPDPQKPDTDSAKFMMGEVAKLVKKYAGPGTALPSVLIAQIMLETGMLTSELWKNANNPAGIKWSVPYTNFPYYEKVSPEWINGQQTQISSKFVKFDTPEEGIMCMTKHMRSTKEREKIYDKVLKATDYKTQAQGLSGTWATDPNYGKKLIELIEKYDLTKYDSNKPVEDNPCPSGGR